MNFFYHFRTTKKFPIFWEFVQYLLYTDKGPVADQHWTPISRLCCLCHQDVNINYILKLESYNAEEKAFLEHKNWQFLPQRVIYDNKKSGMTSAEVTELYFRDISDDDIKKLFSIYQDDFEMLGYTFRRDGLSLP